jgi:hypothetical protein
MRSDGEKHRQRRVATQPCHVWCAFAIVPRSVPRHDPPRRSAHRCHSCLCWHPRVQPSVRVDTTEAHWVEGPEQLYFSATYVRLVYSALMCAAQLKTEHSMAVATSSIRFYSTQTSVLETHMAVATSSIRFYSTQTSVLETHMAVATSSIRLYSTQTSVLETQWNRFNP